MVVVKKKEDSKIEEELSTLTDKFQDLKALMSDLRRKGKDTSFAELYLHDFSPRVKMARVTYSKDDINKVKKLLKELKSELDEADKGDDFSQMMGLIEEAYDDIRNEKHDQVRKTYSDIMKIYSGLPDDLKRLVYVPCLDIRRKISHAAG